MEQANKSKYEQAFGLYDFNLKDEDVALEVKKILKKKCYINRFKYNKNRCVRNNGK